MNKLKFNIKIFFFNSLYIFFITSAVLIYLYNIPILLLELMYVILIDIIAGIFIYLFISMSFIKNYIDNNIVKNTVNKYYSFIILAIIMSIEFLSYDIIETFQLSFGVVNLLGIFLFRIKMWEE